MFSVTYDPEAADRFITSKLHLINLYAGHNNDVTAMQKEFKTNFVSVFDFHSNH